MRIADDIEAKWGYKALLALLKPEPGETVVPSCILDKSRAHRDHINVRIMQMKEADQPTEMPFDMKRMTSGGFSVIVSI